MFTEDALDCLDTPDEVTVMRYELVECLEALLRSLLLHEAHWDKLDEFYHYDPQDDGLAQVRVSQRPHQVQWTGSISSLSQMLLHSSPSVRS